jgi:hypothetical protein
MSVKRASEVLTDVRTAISGGVASVQLADTLRGVQPQQRRHRGIAVWREGTRNREEFRDQGAARVDDTVVVEVSWRLSPKNQHASAQTGRDLADDVLQVVADCDDLVPYHPIYVSTAEQHLGEWLVLTQRYRFTRQQQLGGA